MSRQRGFGLLEGLLALSLGLVVVLAGSRVFVAALKTWQTQLVAARMQDDARLALLRLARDIRGTGMLGCLRLEALQFDDPTAAALFAQPLVLKRAPDGSVRSLTLLVSEPLAGGVPTWTLLTDCLGYARVYAGARPAGPGEFAFALRRQVYRLEDRQLLLSSAGNAAVLIEDVEQLQITPESKTLGQVAALRLQLSLSDPQQRVRRQTYSLTAALRNRVAG